MSEQKSIKPRPGPSSSKFRLRLKNPTRSEESTSSNGNTTPVRQLEKRSGHSTPIRNGNVSANNVEESPEMDHRCSPIMGPCTQQKEVIWNWNSPKEKNDVIRTPKRTAQLQKRRISDSPLMNGSMKVKYKKEEADVNVFMANFEQFNHPSVTVKPEDESEPSTSENWHFESQSHLNSEKNLETSDEVEMRLVYPVDETRIETISEKKNITNINDLFNDEIDDSMLRCSQQVEERFFGLVKEEKLEATSSKSLYNKENKLTFSNNQGTHKIEGIQNLINVTLEKPKEVSKPSVPKEICITIPDDSFDECLSQFMEDDLNSLSKNVEIPQSKIKGLQVTEHLSKKSLFHTGNKSGVKFGSAKSCSILDAKKALNQNRNFTKTKSWDLHNETCKNVAKNLANDFVQKNDKFESHVSPRKFFKTKSLSEPFHDPKTSIASNKNTQETRSKPSTENIRKLTGKSFKCRIYSDTSLNRSIGNSSNKVLGSSQESVISIGNNFDNTKNSNINRSMVLQDQRRAESEETLCTPQEIERKRAEAKMKLEAKRRLLLSSKTTNSTTIFPNPKSVKR